RVCISRSFAVDTQSLGLSAERAEQMPYIASMGIYVFKKEVLIDLLNSSPDSTDFGKEIIPASASDYNVQAYLFDGYWEDIGTIKAFYESNLALTSQPAPDFTFYDKVAPIYTRSRYLPPTKILDCQVTESMISEGCMVKDCQIQRSILGVRSRVGAGSVIDNSLLMGADYYERRDERFELMTQGKIPIGIGSNTTVRGAIVDKNARIGNDVQIINKDRVEEANREDEGFMIRSGITVIVKNAVIPDGTII
ncbi:MAG: sugar phosphate nucleotidyltransferase, partial [Cyanobacteria bacterium P01_F01_bin.153]